MQGGENGIIIFELTPAHEHYGFLLGFLKTWARMNVALTRAKAVLWIVGNWDAWYRHIEILWANKSTQNWALMMVDVAMRGDIVQMYGSGNPRSNFLPDASVTHANEPDASLWTREIEHVPQQLPDEVLPKPSLAKLFNYSSTRSQTDTWKQAVSVYEAKLAEWQKREDAFQKEQQDKRDARAADKKAKEEARK